MGIVESFNNCDLWRIHTGRLVMLIWSSSWRSRLASSDPLTTIDAVPANNDEQWACASLCSLLADPCDARLLSSWHLLATATDIFIEIDFVLRRLHLKSFYELCHHECKEETPHLVMWHFWWSCSSVCVFIPLRKDDIIAKLVRMRTSFLSWSSNFEGPQAW